MGLGSYRKWILKNLGFSKMDKLEEVKKMVLKTCRPWLNDSEIDCYNIVNDTT